jgi:HlyD family secretion protein
VQTVVATGRVENPHRIEIGAQITGTVVRVPVQEGQAVHAGDVLVQLSNAELLAAQRQAEIAVAQAQARLRQVQEVQAPLAQQALRQAQVTADFARATLRRNQDLFTQNFIGAAALDESRKALDLALAQQGAAQQQLNTTGTQGSDFAIAQTVVAQAQASAAAAQARTQYAQIRAPVDGVDGHARGDGRGRSGALCPPRARPRARPRLPTRGNGRRRRARARDAARD